MITNNPTKFLRYLIHKFEEITFVVEVADHLQHFFILTCINPSFCYKSIKFVADIPVNVMMKV
jgi:hypothetical protein